MEEVLLDEGDGGWSESRVMSGGSSLSLMRIVLGGTVVSLMVGEVLNNSVTSGMWKIFETTWGAAT